MSLAADIERAIAALRGGELVAIPTETVYGLAADATNPEAVERIFAAKGRPRGHPLIVHLARTEWLSRWMPDAPELAHELGRRFWPGPLTVIVPRGPDIPPQVTGGLDTVAVRVPAHPVARDIIDGLGRPVAAPSANRFGHVSPTTAEHVRRDLGHAVAVIVDGGRCDVGVESTIIDLSSEVPALVRAGGVTREELESAVGHPLSLATAGAVVAPGTLASHYAPRATVRLVAPERLCEEASRLSRSGRTVGALVSPRYREQLDDRVVAFELSDDLSTAAQQLYAALRELDDRGCDIIVAPLFTEDGLGMALADRLRRAAHGASGQDD